MFSQRLHSAPSFRRKHKPTAKLQADCGRIAWGLSHEAIPKGASTQHYQVESALVLIQGK